MKLTKQQISYAIDRLNRITAERIATKVAATIGAEPEAIKKLTFDQQYALIASGKAKLKPRASVQSYTDLNDAHTYPEHEKARAARQKQIDAWEAKKIKVVAAIHAERDKVIDRIMLADSAEALDWLDKFAKGAPVK